MGAIPNDQCSIIRKEQLTIPTKKRILIVDDEPFNIISMQLSLSRLGIKGLGLLIDRAYNGLEAVNKVKNSFLYGTHVYGLIITDISMPVMDGYDASSEIRDFYLLKKAPQPLIVACTGHVEEDFIKKAWHHGIDELLAKPISIDILSEIFKDIIIQRNESNEH